jgi:hypothetical protein
VPPILPEGTGELRISDVVETDISVKDCVAAPTISPVRVTVYEPGGAPAGPTVMTSRLLFASGTIGGQHATNRSVNCSKYEREFRGVEVVQGDAKKLRKTGHKTRQKKIRSC